jgi:hypothetical protein
MNHNTPDSVIKHHFLTLIEEAFFLLNLSSLLSRTLYDWLNR